MEREKPASFGIKRENLSRYLEIAFYVLIGVAIIAFIIRLIDFYAYHIISPRFGFRKIFLTLLFSSLIYLFYIKSARKKFFSLFIILFSIFALLMEIFFPSFISFSYFSPTHWIYSAIFYLILLFLIFLVFWDVRIGLLLTIFSIPFRESAQIGPMSIELSYLFYIFLAFTLFFFLFKKIKLEREGSNKDNFYKFGNFEIVIMVFLIWNGISLFYAPLYKAGITHLILYYFSGILLYFLVVNIVISSKLLKNLVITILITGVIASLISFYQYYTKSIFYNPVLIENNTRNLLGQGYVFRVNSIFWDPNILAKFLVFVSILCLCFIFSRLKIKNKIFPSVALLLSLFAFILTFSRSGWIILFSSIIVLLILWLLFFKSARVAIVFIILLVLLMAFTGIYFKASIQALTSPELIQLEKIDRIALLKGGWKIFAAHPLFGIGLRGFPTIYFPSKELEELSSFLTRESHTTPVTVADELGLVGFILFIWLLFYFIRESIRGLRTTHDKFLQTLSIGLIGALAAFFISSLFSAFFFEDHFLWLIFALAICIPHIKDGEREIKRSKLNIKLSITIFIFLLIIILFYNFFFPIRGDIYARKAWVTKEIGQKAIKFPGKYRKFEYFDDMTDLAMRATRDCLYYSPNWTRSIYGLALMPGNEGEIVYLFSFDKPLKRAFLNLYLHSTDNSIEVSNDGSLYITISKNKPLDAKNYVIFDITKYVEGSYVCFIKIKGKNILNFEATVFDLIKFYGLQGD